jgi:hypothetical protein
VIFIPEEKNKRFFSLHLAYRFYFLLMVSLRAAQCFVCLTEVERNKKPLEKSRGFLFESDYTFYFT